MNQQEELLLNLQNQLAELRVRSRDFHREIEHLSKQINELTGLIRSQERESTQVAVPGGFSEKPEAGEEKHIESAENQLEPAAIAETSGEKRPGWQSNLEKFIGENLVSKIGMGITIIGVGVGTKYAIDHDLISPATRIILGYLLGLCFTGVAWKLKKQYHHFSAIMCSGAMAIFYLITLAACSYYTLIPRWMAFALMVMITCGTIGSALVYNLQIIAHIGLVGAYAVPFLLDDGSGNFNILFGYIALINTGVLLISIKRYWKPLHYSAFIITWLVVVQWFINYKNGQPELFPAFLFISIFFAIFYILFIGYKMISEQQVEIEDILLLIANSGIFYGIGYSLIHITGGNEFNGLFTAVIALIHGLVWFILRFKKWQDSLLSYIIGGLSVVFLTIAVPVQFDGRWITLLWSAESVMLFFAGRKKGITLFEGFSYLLLILAFFSLLIDWRTVYIGFIPGRPETFILPLINVNFLVSVVVIAATAMINRSVFYQGSQFSEHRIIMRIISAILPALLIIVTYLAFFTEIRCQADQLFADSMKTVVAAGSSPVKVWNETIPILGSIAGISYTLIFVSLFSLVNHKFIRSTGAGFVNLALIMISLAVTLGFGLLLLGELRDAFQAPSQNGYYHGIFLVAVRYILIALVLISLYSLYQSVCFVESKLDFHNEFDIVMHIVILTLLSNELINWLDLAGNANTYKLWLSILFGAYAVFMIMMGILLRKKFVRIGAMILFGLTLVKLFFYDLAFLDTLSKSVVFLSLGILLLVMAFLYNKFTKRIFEEH